MRCFSGLALLALVVCPVAVQAEHALIDLRVFRLDTEGKMADQARATSDQEPPLGGLNPRPLFKAKANDPLVLQFILTNTYPHGVNKGVVVRYYVVREDKIGQKTLPDLKQDMVTQGRCHLNFRPKSRVGARVAFTVPTPGVYLLRVDTLNTNGDHEHFSAIDLQVE
jgi:hypothetical protein